MDSNINDYYIDDEINENKENVSHANAFTCVCLILLFSHMGLLLYTQISLHEYDQFSTSLSNHQSTITNQKKICKMMNTNNSEHTIGKWMQTNFTKNETWPCCGWDSRVFLGFPVECGTTPMQKQNGSYVGNMQFFAHSGGNGCQRNCNFKLGRIISATWKPSNCVIFPFSAQKLCDLLHNRSILIIGDSTMEQTASVLMNSVHFHCPQQIRFALGDTLVDKNFGVMNRGSAWYKSVDKFDPDIIILNAGEHIRKETDFMNVIESVYTQYKNRYTTPPKNKLLIWKTVSPGGIPELGILDEFPDLFDNETLQKWKSFGYRKEWRWDIQQRFDELAKNYFRQKQIPVLDVKPLFYRSDNHPGTNVHHCAHGNGALRLIPRLLQHLLQELKI
eukprot:211622_1